MNKALIFIPGIKGTKLYDANTINNEVLWEDVRFNFDDISRTELTFQHNERFYEEDYNTIVKPLQIEPLAYREFWKKLNPVYKNKFIFPYDWRLPNKENGRRLKLFMDELVEKSKASDRVATITHFDFVTHSMGNMPLRYYIQAHGMDRIDKIVFTVPPFLGAADAISAMAVGQGFFFKRDEIRKLARSLPALFELLPTYSHYAIDASDGSPIDLWNKDNWQKNLVTQGNDPEKNRSIEKFIVNLNTAKSELENLSKWMDHITEEQKAKMMVLVKTDVKTLTDIVIEKHPADGNPDNYFDFQKSLQYNEGGDGVVPCASSCHYFEDIPTYDFRNRPWLDDFKHPFFLKDNRVQRIINSYLSTSQNASGYENKVFGRSVHRVTALKNHQVSEDGITHIVTEI
ncbi:MAG: hypothetical protein RIB47_10920 [Cyclobacteriaceae bacterium]